MELQGNAAVKLPEAYDGLEYQAAWEHFHNFTQIARASGNEAAALQYVREWADEYDFEVTQDEKGNMCVKVPGSKGYENDPSVCVQGHADLVFAKTDESPFTKETGNLNVIRDGDYITADGTSLGADNAFGLSVAMAFAQDPESVHPPMELLFTVEEETGLFGAKGLDCEALGMKSTVVINVDNEDLGEVCVQSAGLRMATGTRSINRVSESTQSKKGKYYELSIKDLPGGHSAEDIPKDIPNAILWMGTMLDDVKNSVRLVSIDGGDQVNGIPTWCTAIVFVEDKHAQEFSEFEEDFLADAFGGHGGSLSSKELSPSEAKCTAMTQETHDEIMSVLTEVPNGVKTMHPDFPKKAFTSSNVGKVRMAKEGNSMSVGFSVRSPEESEVATVSEEIVMALADSGFKTETDFEILSWNADRDSEVVKAASQAYFEETGKKAKISVTHGGLETGTVQSALADHLGVPLSSIGTVAIGMDIDYPHSPRERMSIKGAETYCGQFAITMGIAAKWQKAA